MTTQSMLSETPVGPFLAVIKKWGDSLFSFKKLNSPGYDVCVIRQGLFVLRLSIKPVR